MRTLLLSAVLLVVGITISAWGAGQDELVLSSGDKLMDVKVLDQNWSEILVQVTESTRFVFRTDEVREVTVAKESRDVAAGEADLVHYYGLEITKILSRQLAQKVSVDKRDVDLQDVIEDIFHSQEILVFLDDPVAERILSGELDPICTVSGEDLRFIQILRDLSRQKSLQLQANDAGDAIYLTLRKE